jgi:hypothetical protein
LALKALLPPLLCAGSKLLSGFQIRCLPGSAWQRAETELASALVRKE